MRFIKNRDNVSIACLIFLLRKDGGRYLEEEVNNMVDEIMRNKIKTTEKPLKMQEIFAMNVKKLLKNQSKTQNDLSKALGFTTLYVSMLLEGKRVVTNEIVKTTASFLNVSIKELMVCNTTKEEDYELFETGDFNSRRGRRAIDQVNYLIDEYLAISELAIKS